VESGLKGCGFDNISNKALKSWFFYCFQSGFRPGDSTVMQLIFVVNNIYQALEKGYEVRAVFLDISKAFHKVWHEGLTTNGPLLQWFDSYLTERYQQVTIEGMSSDWARIKAGVPQGSVLGPLLFFIYIKNIALFFDLFSFC
jgi:hypothetical protein